MSWLLHPVATNWLSFVENITVLLQYVNLSHSLGTFKFCIFGYYKPLLNGF